MTAPKLTPAEALAALRSRYDSGRTYEPWARILEEFGDGDAGKFASECWSCIGSALARLAALESKPEPDAPVPTIEIEPKTFFVVSPGAPCRFTERVVVRRFDEEKSVAPVPSDEEIRDAVEYVRCSRTDLDALGRATYMALRMVCQRIGVKL